MHEKYQYNRLDATKLKSHHLDQRALNGEQIKFALKFARRASRNE